ncbi:hypothetical protein D3C73_1326760 [compost metagenome]
MYGIPQEPGQSGTAFVVIGREALVIHIHLGYPGMGFFSVSVPVETEPLAVQVSGFLRQFTSRIAFLHRLLQRRKHVFFELLNGDVLFFRHVTQLAVRLLYGFLAVFLPDLLSVFLLVIVDQLLLKACEFLFVTHGHSPF